MARKWIFCLKGKKLDWTEIDIFLPLNCTIKKHPKQSPNLRLLTILISITNKLKYISIPFEAAYLNASNTIFFFSQLQNVELAGNAILIFLMHVSILK